MKDNLPIRRFLTDVDLENRTGQRKQTWRLRRMRGDGPAYFKIGGRVYYEEEELFRWLSERRFSSTAEETVRRNAQR